VKNSLKKFSKIIDILKSKWLKNTGKTVILIAIIIAIFLGINILITNLDPKDIDLTKEKFYSLSEESKEKIKALPEEDKINIYMFDYQEQSGIVELIKEYEKVNKNIKVELVSVEDRPDLASKYGVDSGYYTVIIENGDKHKFFTQYDFVSYDYKPTGEVDGVDITEQRMTNSIISISSVGKNVPIYELSGHEEKSMSSYMAYFKAYLELENYEIKTLDLMSEPKVPEDCAGLIIASPKKDFMEGEVIAIKEYIERGGNILWLNDPYAATVETPNIKAILDIYGVNIRQDGLVLEQDRNKMSAGMQDVIMPTIESTEITSKIEANQVILFSTGKLEFAEDMSALNVTKTDMLRTSMESFFRTNLQEVNLSPVEGEKEESSVVAAILEKKMGEEDSEKTSRLVIFANNMFATNEPIYTSTGTTAAIGFRQNKDIAVNSVQYIAEIKDAMTIRKPIETTNYTATEAQDSLIKVIIFGLPVIIILAGIVVWQLRRRKK